MVRESRGRELVLWLMLISICGECVARPELGSGREREDEVEKTNDVEPELSESSTAANIEKLLSERKLDENEVGGVRLEVVDKERLAYAERMLSYMNRTIDPCDDFYEYACGNWKNTIEDRWSTNKRNNLLDIEFKLIDIAGEILSSPAEDLDLDPDYLEVFEKAQQLYESCLKADLYPFKRSEVYLDIIKSIGGFPAVDKSWDPETFDWFNMSSHLTLYKAGGFIKEEILPIFPFPPYFELPNIGFDSIAHTDSIASKETRVYKKNEKRMLTYLQAYGLTAEESGAVVEDIFSFWREILNVTERFKDDADLCKVLTMNSTEGDFDRWNNHMKIAWPGISFDFEIHECPCNYLYVKFDQICKANKEAAANYLAMKLLYALDPDLRDIKYQKEFCTASVLYGYRYLINEIYIKRHFTKDIENELTIIVKEVRKRVRAVLEQADWLDDKTREEALLKEARMESRLGRLEDKNATDLIINYLKTIPLTPDNFEQNTVELAKALAYLERFSGYNVLKISPETKPLVLYMGMQANAFYYNIDNSINVMAGVTHPPVYEKSWPYSLKFGTIGFLIGHEFTHGFDTGGSNYDSDGEERYWWSEKSGKVFTNRTHCFVDEFNKYYIPEINRHINGNLTKDENIADSGGLKAAFRAYHKFIDEISKESDKKLIEQSEKMPGLDLTTDQLFFLGFAQLWCSSYKEEHYWEEMINEHPIDKYRVLGAVTNVEEFSTTFHCPKGSKMNPNKTKCNVW